MILHNLKLTAQIQGITMKIFKALEIFYDIINIFLIPFTTNY